jgi:type VI secretion system protein ImpA
MAHPTVAALCEPIAEDNPCGPDLYEADDPEFMHFMAHGEGLLPTSFFKAQEGSEEEITRPFDPSTVDFKTAFAAAAPYLRQTHDVRLLTLLAKFCVLSRDLAGFAAYLEALAKLTAEQWEGVHPRGEGGDFALRLAALQSLDDTVTVVLPLQHMPLVKPARGAPIAMRAQLIATGELAARANEEQPDAATIERSLKECEIDHLVDGRAAIRRAAEALTAIRAATIEHAGHAEAAKFERLEPLVGKIAAFLNDAIARRDPSLAENGDAVAMPEAAGGADAAAPAGDIRNLREVAAALGAVEAYFSHHEPSNPALLLVRQATQLVGKSFVEAMNVLVPGFVDQARVSIGRTEMFDVPLQSLAAFSVANGAGEGGAEIAPMVADTRAQATGLMAQVVAFYTRGEPSSPVPFLVERARALVGRDFLSILKDILPENTLRNPRAGN